jgi:anti-anti-sigma factor
MSVTAEILSRHRGVYDDGTVRYTEEGERIILSLSGSLDLECSHRLQKFLVELIGKVNQPYAIEVDMSDVRYVSSTGVGAIVNALVAAKHKDVAFRAYGFQPKVQAVFRLLGLLSFFEDSGREGGSG